MQCDSFRILDFGLKVSVVRGQLSVARNCKPAVFLYSGYSALELRYQTAQHRCHGQLTTGGIRIQNRKSRIQNTLTPFQTSMYVSLRRTTPSLFPRSAV
jgi:hypothetical protein